MAKKKRRERMRLDIAIGLGLLVMVVTFLAYMLDTSLEDVLERERGEGAIITHTVSQDK